MARWLPLLLALLLLAPAARADDEGDDEFETGWIGLRVGAWFQPIFNMDVQVTGRPLGGLTNLVGTDFDVKRDLGVEENPRSTALVDFDESAVLELSPFVETRWVSVYGWLVTPFEYRGETQLTRTINFAGQSFSASTTVDSKFRQAFFGTDVTINIFNNRYFRVSPLVGARALLVDWEIRDSLGGLRGDTTDINSPLRLGDFQVLPYPELGFAVHAGYRDYIEVRLLVAGSYVDYFGFEGGSYRVEASVTAYPIPWVGIQLGARYLEFDFSSQTDNSRNGSFDFDLEYLGANLSLIVRI